MDHVLGLRLLKLADDGGKFLAQYFARSGLPVTANVKSLSTGRPVVLKSEHDPIPDTGGGTVIRVPEEGKPGKPIPYPKNPFPVQELLRFHGNKRVAGDPGGRV